MTPAEPALRGTRLSSAAVLGAGSWGSALAIQLARSGLATTLWGRNVVALAAERENRRYLPGFAFPHALRIEPDLAAAVAHAALVLVCVPSDALRDVLRKTAPVLQPGQRVAWATKGFERETALLPHQVAKQELDDRYPLAVISGPTFALEVARGLPSALSVAAADPVFGADLALTLHGSGMRAYATHDMTGVGVGGAVKNVMAIGIGVSDGLGFGANARAALITRGLTEIMRLGEALGGQRETFTGLAGLGDLVLTCTDDQSRNRRFGLALAGGRKEADARAAIGQVVEGAGAAREVRRLACRLQIDMPITEQVYRLLYAGIGPEDAANTLSGRPPRREDSSRA